MTVLNIRILTECVIGQLFGDYNDFMKSRNDKFLLDNGFTSLLPTYSNFAKLTTAWKKVIREKVGV